MGEQADAEHDQGQGRSARQGRDRRESLSGKCGESSHVLAVQRQRQRQHQPPGGQVVDPERRGDGQQRDVQRQSGERGDRESRGIDRRLRLPAALQPEQASGPGVAQCRAGRQQKRHRRHRAGARKRDADDQRKRQQVRPGQLRRPPDRERPQHAANHGEVDEVFRADALPDVLLPQRDRKEPVQRHSQRQGQNCPGSGSR